MAKAFTEREKQLIREKLIEAGIELFSKYGIKKTSIRDISKLSGIASGTFYNFYSSKEEFFLDMLEEAHSENIILDYIKNIKVIDKDSLTGLFKVSFSILDKNPLTNILVNHKEEFEALLRKVPEEIALKHYNHDVELTKKIFNELEKRGFKVEIKPDVLVHFFKSLMILYFDSDIMGTEKFNEVIDFVCEMLATFMIAKRID